jgi:hypothetical protein
MNKKKILEMVKNCVHEVKRSPVSFVPTFPGNLDPVYGKISLGFTPVQEPFDSQQVSPPTIYVIAPSKHHLILRCRSRLPREPVTGNYLSGSPYPSRVFYLSRVR